MKKPNKHIKFETESAKGTLTNKSLWKGVSAIDAARMALLRIEAAKQWGDYFYHIHHSLWNVNNWN